VDDWLLIAGDFTPLGGMDRANHALARGLAARGHRVSLVTHRAWDDLSGRVHTSRVARPGGSHLLGSPLLASAGARAARSARGRVVVNGGNTVAGDITWIHYLHAAHTPIVTRGAGRVRAAAAHRYYLRREKASIRAARFVVCNSVRTADGIAAAYDVERTRLRVVYYGSDPSAFAPVDEGSRSEARRSLRWPDGRFTALFIGGLGDRRKGFDRLFEAWQLLAKSVDWDVDLAVAGSGREVTAWQSRAQAGRLSSVRFLGFRDDIARVIAASDVVVHPSRYEAYGLAVHEAICRGLPAVVSATAGVAERIEGPLRTLLIDNAESATEIANRLREWRRSIAQYRSAAAALGATLRQRTWDDMVNDFIAAVALPTASGAA
jgi:glycosyltransferase involved in cell wall biosynthesis